MIRRTASRDPRHGSSCERSEVMTADPRLVAAILRDDFYSFVQASFPIVSPGASFTPNWHIEAMTFALSRVLNGEIKRLIITVPPRSLKSICASVAFPAFVLGHDPTRRIICVSYAEGLARKHANDCRAVMRSGSVPSPVPEDPDQRRQGHRAGVRDHAWWKPALRPRSGAPSRAAAETSSSSTTP